MDDSDDSSMKKYVDQTDEKFVDEKMVISDVEAHHRLLLHSGDISQAVNDVYANDAEGKTTYLPFIIYIATEYMDGNKKELINWLLDEVGKRNDDWQILQSTQLYWNPKKDQLMNVNVEDNWTMQIRFKEEVDAMGFRLAFLD